MNLAKRKLLTIVTEATLENRLVKDIKSLGAHGYTAWDARGEGKRGVRGGDWDQNRNVCIQVICDEPTAQAIASHCHTHYYRNYAMVITIAEVEVMRPEKF